MWECCIDCECEEFLADVTGNANLACGDLAGTDKSSN